MESSLYSLELEKHLISGLIKFPKVYAEIAAFFKNSDLSSTAHQTIFSVVANSILTNSPLDYILLGQKIQDLGISLPNGLTIFEYLDALSVIQLTEQAVLEAAKGLIKLRILRDIEETGRKLTTLAHESKAESVNNIIAAADKTYSDKISLINHTEQPVDLFNGLEALVEDRGNNPREETGLTTPFPEFNRLYGGLREGNVYAIVSRPEAGKTTFLDDLTYNTCFLNPETYGLILDTEMRTEDIRFRTVSAFTGVPMWYLETGNWRKNEEMFKKVRAFWPQMPKYQNRVQHFYVAGKSIEEISSIIRRWYYQGKKKNAIVTYDYIKLTGEKVSDAMKEHQVIGQKIDKLKQLSEELKFVNLTACQLNRDAERGTDDSSAIAQSDRLQWFASFVAIFRRKTLEEIAADGEEFGTHKLIRLKTRFQGRDAAGHHDYVRVDEHGKVKYKSNYLCYDVRNFSVKECGSLRQIIDKKSESMDIPMESKKGDLV